MKRMRWHRRRPLSLSVVSLCAWAISSCAPSGFPDAALVASVRIIASAADQPYVRPGAPVKVTLLAADARPSKPAKMNVAWLPFVCENPDNDAYYGCFAQLASRFAGAPGAPDGGIALPGRAASRAIACPGGPGGRGEGDAGADGDSAAPEGAVTPSGDLTQLLILGDCISFAMPGDAVDTHSNSPPPPTPYGVTIVFNVACAGHVEAVPLDPSNPQSPPIGCFDSSHNRLGPNDYVFGFTRVYASNSTANTNPVIDHIDSEGQTLDLGAGLQVAACPSGTSCPGVHIGPAVPASSQEVNPEERDMAGKPLKEEIWAEFFSTLGSFKYDTRLLYDPKTGSLGAPIDTDTQFQPPSNPGEGTLWVVVHDNRGGATWAELPVHVY